MLPRGHPSPTVLLSDNRAVLIASLLVLAPTGLRLNTRDSTGCRAGPMFIL